MPQNRPGDGGPKGLAEAYRYAGLGMQFAGGILLFTGAGWLLDRWLGTLPLCLIAGAVVGTVMGFVVIYRRVVILGAKDERGHLK